MSVTTAADLLAVTQRRTRQLTVNDEPITRQQWDVFDNTVYQLLSTLWGHRPRHVTGPLLGVTLSTYPTPVRPWTGDPYQQPDRSPVETAVQQQLASTGATGATRIASRALLLDRPPRPTDVGLDGAVVTAAGPLVDEGPDPLRPDASEPHPLARLSLALGALQEVLTDSAPAHHVRGERRDYRELALTPADTDVIARTVLTTTWVAARHALTHLPITDAERPLRIAQHLARTLDTLSNLDSPETSSARPDTGSPRSYGPRAANSAVTAGVSAGQGSRVVRAVDDALDMWTAAAREALELTVPSGEVIRSIYGIGVHTLAVTAATLERPTPRGTGPDSAQATPAPDSQNRSSVSPFTDLHADLRDTATALNQAGRLWTPLTTAMPPSRAYVTATRDLRTALNGVQTSLAAGDLPPGSADRARLQQVLILATPALAARISTIHRRTEQLLHARLLFKRAETGATNDLKYFYDRAKVHTELVRPRDAPDLLPTSYQAYQRIANLSRELSRYLAPTALAPPTPRAAPNLSLSL